MREIRELGVSISIDDFGTGYSSLSYLSKLPVDSLKIDQSFLRRLLEPSGSLPVVQSIVRLAHGMHLAVVAEGVETEA
jgi:EAL domain-containing protein (putative c-di-GMP-specific phosphodiesterase class I)